MPTVIIPRVHHDGVKSIEGRTLVVNFRQAPTLGFSIGPRVRRILTAVSLHWMISWYANNNICLSVCLLFVTLKKPYAKFSYTDTKLLARLPRDECLWRWRSRNVSWKDLRSRRSGNSNRSFTFTLVSVKGSYWNLVMRANKPIWSLQFGYQREDTCEVLKVAYLMSWRWRTGGRRAK